MHLNKQACLGTPSLHQHYLLASGLPPGLERPTAASVLPPRGPFLLRSTMNEGWRVAFAIGATAVVAVGAFMAIRFIIGLHL